jgi:hypothetical protein
MDADRQLLDKVLAHDTFLESALLNDSLEDWNVAKELGEFLVRVIPEDIIGHALLVRACRHTGDINRAREELIACQGYLDRNELGPRQLDLLLPMLEREELLLNSEREREDPH